MLATCTMGAASCLPAKHFPGSAVMVQLSDLSLSPAACLTGYRKAAAAPKLLSASVGQ